MTKRIVALLLLATLVAAACSADDGGETASDETSIEDILGDPGDCIVVDMSVSPEKIDLLTDLARTFNGSGVEVDGECVFVRPQSKSSGLGAIPADRRAGTRTPKGPSPVIWSPASSAWGAIVDQRLTEAGRRADRRRGHAVHAHAARHRHARADGRGPRATPTSPSASPTSSSCRPAARAGPPSATPSGARSGSARPTPTSPPAGCPPSSPRATRPPARPRA